MCGICTLINVKNNLLDEKDLFFEMNALLKHRGSNIKSLISQHCLMNHYDMYDDYIIQFDGELYNKDQLKQQLIDLGYQFKNNHLNELVLTSYKEWKEDCVNHFEGAFVFIIKDKDNVFISRDHLGIKPLFYCIKDETLILSSEIKCILKYLGECVVDQEGIKQFIGLGPSLVPGQTIYKDIYMLRPAHYMIYNGDLCIKRYWNVEEKTHNDSLEESKNKLRKLVEESIIQQSDEQICGMLSGGLDSSIICAILARKHPLTTYSVNYEEQSTYFKAYDYQKSMDDEYIKDMIHQYPLDHHEVILSQEELVTSLKDALICRDMPGMADIDASLLLFGKHISNNYSLCLSGECADEILGGYPWYYREELMDLDTFPWLRSLDYKLSLFNDYVQSLNIKDYIKEKYEESLQEIHTFDHHKQLIYLNIEWFMQTLLLRADSQCQYSSLKVRVPFANHQLVNYVYNMPKDYLLYQGEEKGLLREAFKDILPSSIVHRKKNPYPKTHHPLYTQYITQLLNESLNDSNNILFELMDKDVLKELIDSKGEMIKEPVYGQLMMGPQFLAYLYQIYLWGSLYQVKIQKN